MPVIVFLTYMFVNKHLFEICLFEFYIISQKRFSDNQITSIVQIILKMSLNIAVTEWGSQSCPKILKYFEIFELDLMNFQYEFIQTSFQTLYKLW
jgi:hypothetical protein